MQGQKDSSHTLVIGGSATKDSTLRSNQRNAENRNKERNVKAQVTSSSNLVPLAHDFRLRMQSPISIGYGQLALTE